MNSRAISALDLLKHCTSLFAFYKFIVTMTTNPVELWNLVSLLARASDSQSENVG